MKINLLFFIIFASVGLLLLILSLIFKSNDKKLVKQCRQITKGRVIKYTLSGNNGVHFPIVEYNVDNAKYTQRLKYGWIVNKSSSFNDINTKAEGNVNDDNLVIKSNTHISGNALKEYFPVGTELEVFYNPQNPKKSFVMRFVKNPAVKVLFFTGLLFIVIAFIGLILLPA